MARKRSTARDVAELAGVSRTTVSFVLNNVSGMRISAETRQTVQEAALRLNYHPDATARRMVSGETRLIGFVLRQSPDQAFADQFLPQVLRGINQFTHNQGYHILFQTIPPENHSGAYSRLIRERHVDGVLVSGPRFDDQELLRIHAEGAPVVIIGQLPNVNIPFVDVDNIGGAALATQHILSLGHQRIGLITNAPLEYTGSAQRMDGYRQALVVSGVSYDESLVRFGNFTPQSGVKAMEELFALDSLPTAVFVASDTVALGALQSIRAHGLRVPEDIALVGFDDVPLAEFVDPPLTTIRLPAFGLGWAAADLLISLIMGEERPSPHQLLETELVVRASSGANLVAAASTAN